MLNWFRELIAANLKCWFKDVHVGRLVCVVHLKLKLGCVTLRSQVRLPDRERLLGV